MCVWLRIYHHLISSHLISSHLISSHLISSSLIFSFFLQGGGGTNGVLSRVGSCLTDAALITAAVFTDGATLGIDAAAEAAAEESAGAAAGEGIETAEGVTGATSDGAAETAADAGEEGTAQEAAAEEKEEAEEVEEAEENTCSTAKKYNPTTLAKMYVESQWMMPMSCAPQNITMWLDMGNMFREQIVGMPIPPPPPPPPGMAHPKCGVNGSKAVTLCKPFFVGKEWKCLANEVRCVAFAPFCI